GLSRRASAATRTSWVKISQSRALSGERLGRRIGAANILFRGSRERRQLADVAQVVLNDDGRFEIGGDLLHAFDRGDRRRAVEVEDRHTVTFVVLAEVDRVATEQYRAHVLQPDQQAAVACRVTPPPQN